MSNTTLQIISRHQTLRDAVKAAKLDLSYNPQVAEQQIGMLDHPLKQHSSVKEAFVVVDSRTGEQIVVYVMKCDIVLLNKFEPFHSVLDDTDFKIVTIDSEIKIHNTCRLPRSKEARKIIASTGVMVTTLN